MKTLLTPECIPGSSSCVQLKAPGNLYIQSLDSYGYLRELSLTEQDGGFRLHVYQHPGRREITQLTRAQGRKLIAALIGRAESGTYRDLMFNPHSPGQPRNVGFVRFQEAAFRGVPFADLLAMV
jgi:hypothetical protein